MSQGCCLLQRCQRLPRLSIPLRQGCQRPQIGKALPPIGLDACTQALHLLPGPLLLATPQQCLDLKIAEEVDEEQRRFDVFSYCYGLQRVDVCALPVTSESAVRAQPGGGKHLIRPDRDALAESQRLSERRVCFLQREHRLMHRT